MSSFEEKIISIYGEEGKKWLDAVPDISSKIARQYSLDNLSPFKNMSFNYIAHGDQNDKPIILKIALDTQALAKEASCLKAFSKYGAAEVIADTGNMILM